jgi:hypothetical protein
VARFHKPNRDVDRAIDLGVEHGENRPHGTLEPHVNPFSYGTPCYWAYKGAYEATLKAYP